ncbi:hypothetical protein BDD12DRAFT_299093 [Trichophaea hybrida]|nr:hypothetical protein BDD12DRAFT_299093 [Trichophaea hybrida]
MNNMNEMLTSGSGTCRARRQGTMMRDPGMTYVTSVECSTEFRPIPSAQYAMCSLFIEQVLSSLVWSGGQTVGASTSSQPHLSLQFLVGGISALPHARFLFRLVICTYPGPQMSCLTIHGHDSPEGANPESAREAGVGFDGVEGRANHALLSTPKIRLSLPAVSQSVHPIHPSIKSSSSCLHSLNPAASDAPFYLKRSATFPHTRRF